MAEDDISRDKGRRSTFELVQSFISKLSQSPATKSFGSEIWNQGKGAGRPVHTDETAVRPRGGEKKRRESREGWQCGHASSWSGR
jgi:hypothetical protein